MTRGPTVGCCAPRRALGRETARRQRPSKRQAGWYENRVEIALALCSDPDIESEPGTCRAEVASLDGHCPGISDLCGCFAPAVCRRTAFLFCLCDWRGIPSGPVQCAASGQSQSGICRTSDSCGWNDHCRFLSVSKLF